ncbi:MAG TPA: hypothetical protein VGK67_15830 [Myxococcales bacterium]|jgi:hypothetical protein
MRRKITRYHLMVVALLLALAFVGACGGDDGGDYGNDASTGDVFDAGK